MFLQLKGFKSVVYKKGLRITIETEKKAGENEKVKREKRKDGNQKEMF